MLRRIHGPECPRTASPLEGEPPAGSHGPFLPSSIPMMDSSNRQQLFETGIQSFDRLLGGGIPRRQTLIVAGNPGCGKTILCSQVAFQAAARGLPVVLATVTSEPHDKLVEALSGFS